MIMWARFIYGPLLDDRERTIARTPSPANYGRREAFAVHKILKEKGPVTVAARIRLHGPRRDRPRRRLPAPGSKAETGTGLFNETIQDFDLQAVSARQKQTFAEAQIPLPA